MIDVRLYGAKMDGVASDVAAINLALIAGDVIIQNGICLINSSILIPSNRTLYLKNCKIRTADVVYDNVFRNADPINGNTNIHVIGLGNTIIDENSVNNYSLNYGIYGGGNLTAQNLYKANAFFFCNVTNFSVKNLTFADHKHYVAAIQQCSYGTFENLYFNHTSTTRNQDGIQVIYGSHHLTFRNMYGFTGDDFVSIFLGSSFGTLHYPLANFTIGDCHDIEWDNLLIYSVYHAVIFITGDGNKIYNIRYSNVNVIRCSFLTYFGYNYYAVPPTADEFKDIIFDNISITTNYESKVIDFRENCKNIAITNFVNNSGKTDYIRTSGIQENVVINGVAIYP